MSSVFLKGIWGQKGDSMIFIELKIEFVGGIIFVINITFEMDFIRQQTIMCNKSVGKRYFMDSGMFCKIV